MASTEGWGKLGVYAAACCSVGCIYWARQRSIASAPENNHATAPRLEAGDAPPNVDEENDDNAVVLDNDEAAAQGDADRDGDGGDDDVGGDLAIAPVHSLPSLHLSAPAKFSSVSTLVGTTAFLGYRQTQNAVRTLGLGLASLIWLPLNATGMRLPATVLNIAVPPPLRKVGTFLFACSTSVVGLLAMRHLYSDSATFVLINVMGSVPLLLETGDWVLQHREQVESRVRHAVQRWTSSQDGSLAFVDEYVC